MTNGVRAGFLPPETPLPMPAQDLRLDASRPADWPKARLLLRRALVLLVTAAVTAGGVFEMYEVLKVGGITVLEAVVLVFYVALLAWVALSFASSLAGLIVLLFGAVDPLGTADLEPVPPQKRTAMLMPTYNEDPRRLFARLRAMMDEVAEAGGADRFDWFILSDTTDPAIWIAEEAGFLSLRPVVNGQLFYRHRTDNTGRKAGNIGDWVRRFGGSYETMLILDADSLMTADALFRLAAAMEVHPRIGLIQTLPVIVNARTRFARLQQFAGALYGPLIAAGIAWWHGPDGNYWGHNAIIRVRAFAAHAGLPELSGRSPFGGHILSHDFVEAALMRRGGWAIVMAPTVSGSYEEVPPSLLDFAARDRRWCQGNLQHLAVLPARGLHPLSRLHLLTGIGAYVTAPLWLTFLLLGVLLALQAQFVRPDYFPKGFSLFPLWPSQDPVRAAWVFAGTMGLLLVPKLLALTLALGRRRTRRAFGGGFALCAGVLFEIIVSGLMAPVMMLFQTSAVVAVLSGRDAGWKVQRRDDGALDRTELLRRYGPITLAGVLTAITAFIVSIPLLLWMTPVVLGLVLAIPMAIGTSGTARSRLMATPEDLDPPSVLLRARALEIDDGVAPSDPLVALRRDGELFRHHLATLALSRRRGQISAELALARAKVADATTFDEAREFLERRETAALLADRETLVAAMELP